MDTSNSPHCENCGSNFRVGDQILIVYPIAELDLGTCQNCWRTVMAENR